MSVSVVVNIHDDAIKRTLGPSSYFGTVYLPRIGNQIVNAAKRRANVDTGLMRSTIEFRIISGNPVTGEVVARTKYALFVHNGTKYYAGNPYLTDAARDVLG